MKIFDLIEFQVLFLELKFKMKKNEYMKQRSDGAASKLIATASLSQDFAK